MTAVDRDAMRRYEASRDVMVAEINGVEARLPPAERASLENTRERLNRARFVLAVVGEFSSGKSFLLNALLGKFRYENDRRLVGLLATAINPSTATITELQFGDPEEAHAYYEDGRVERIPLDRLARFIAVGDAEGKLHDATAQEDRAPVRVVIDANSAFLQRGFAVADTPGLASVNPAHRRATLQFLPRADAVLYLIDTQQPFTEGDAAFLGIVRQHVDSIFIVQTKIDLWRQAQDDSRQAWQSAYDRIASLAAIHAPGTYVYALSAREFAEGTLLGDPHVIEESRFPAFLDALDASLIATTGRARLRRAAKEIATALEAGIEQHREYAAMLARTPLEIRQRLESLEPQYARLQERVSSESENVRARGAARRSIIREQAGILAEEAQSTLAQTFDTADIARLRDRARLHILVDRAFADVVGEFAEQIANATLAEIEELRLRADAALPVAFSAGDAAAQCFGAEPGTGLWGGDTAQAIAAAIVLEAVGGPAIALVGDIAGRFERAPAGAYMKRELTADLRTSIFPELRRHFEAFALELEEQLHALYESLARSVSEAFARKRERELGSVERAHAAHAAGQNASAIIAELEADAAAFARAGSVVAAALEDFAAREPEIAPADAGPDAVRRTRTAHFDDAAYALGLRPQRWRVAVVGALRRGKSSLINAIAGTRVLGDELAGTIAFPVHVRYGPVERSHALRPDGSWQEVEIESALQEATANPVLIETPWSLPRELVLVHVPAFDAGDERGEEIAVLAASRASEVLCLFSRQLSDRELDIFERIAELGKPLLFAHTLADNETASERRDVVELAKTYLSERNIVANRIFTISTLDYAQARREARAPAGWNELPALISTMTADAEAHMERLRRLERAAVIERPRAAAPERRPGLLGRFFRRKR